MLLSVTKEAFGVRINDKWDENQNQERTWCIYAETVFKYIFQSIAGMIGISVYILADTFLYQFIQAQMAWQF